MLGLVALTICIVFLPKVKAVPASLVAIIVVLIGFRVRIETKQLQILLL
jgi:hypothetical protein